MILCSVSLSSSPQSFDYNRSGPQKHLNNTKEINSNTVLRTESQPSRKRQKLPFIFNLFVAVRVFGISRCLVQWRLLIRIPLYEIQKSVRCKGGKNMGTRQRGVLDSGTGGRMFPHACQSLSKFRIDEAHRQHC